jgi:hypothetical protein
VKHAYRGLSFCKDAYRKYDVESIHYRQVESLSSGTREFVNPYLIPVPTRKEEGLVMEMKVSVIAIVKPLISHSAI